MTRQVWAVGLLHPAFILRGQWSQEPAQVLYLKRAKEIAAHGWTPVDLSRPPRGAITEPVLGDLHTWEETSDLRPGGIAVDIETAGRRIRGVGLCGVSSLLALWVPFCHAGGAHYWTGGEWTDVERWLGGILGDPTIPKYFHNGLGFDIPILRHNGFRVEGYAGDTMLAHHIAYPEIPKGLKYLSNVYLGVGGWKSLVTEDDEGDGK